MTKEEFKDLLGIADEDPTDDEAVWPVIVEFVAEWLEDDSGDRIPHRMIADDWRREMA